MYLNIRSKQRVPSGRDRAREAGFSLVEGLMAAALLLVVAVSVLPVFVRAVESNTRGGRASQVTAFVNSEIESVNQAFISRDEWQLESATSVLETGTDFWDVGQLYENLSSPAKIGDEQWVEDRASAEQVLWSRDMDIRKYSFADVHTTISVAGTELATLGDPRWFDRPLTTDEDGGLFNAHVTEFRVHIVEDRENIPLDSGQRMTVGHFRTF